MAMTTRALLALCFALLHGPHAGAAPCDHVGRPHKVLAPKLKRIAFTICERHFPKGSAEEAAIQYCVDHLNAVQDSTLRFSIAGHAPHREYHDTLKRDGVFRIDVVKPEATRSGDSSFAGRTARSTGGTIREFDIALNKRSRWNYGQPTSWAMKSGSGGFLRSILLHEIGHGLGFPHCAKTTEDLSIMGGKCGKWVGMKEIGLKPHDREHMRFHYGTVTRTGKADLALGNYKTERAKVDKGLWKCQLTTPPAKQVAAGQTLTIEWTRFNLGSKGAKQVSMRAVLSRDNKLSSDDLVLERWCSGAAPAGSTITSTRRLTVPRRAGEGRYNILLVVDAKKTIKESREDNNLLPIHQKVTVTKRAATVRRGPRGASPSRLYQR
jgi:hypothetical protein